MKGLSIITGILGFAGGAVAGYFFGKKKFEKKADEEIESVKKMYETHFKGQQDSNTSQTPQKEEPKKEEPKKEVMSNVTYTPAPLVDPTRPAKENISPKYKLQQDYSGPYKPAEVTMSDLPPNDDLAPRIIDEEEFRDSPYDTRTIWRYHDDVWTDEDGNVLNYPKLLLGETGYQVARTGKECTYVLDERSSTVYEVLNDVRNWHTLPGHKKGANLDEDDD